MRMKEEAVARGDQPYGAVLVVAGVIAGYGPSRVNSDRNPDAHACQRALATARVERMLVGPTAEDAGRPQGG